MINALRHQRLVHPYPLAKKSRLPLSDQRLTASKVSTLIVYAVAEGIVNTVINALRHQRLVHATARVVLLFTI